MRIKIMAEQSIDNLNNILEHVNYRFNFLTGVVYRKVREDCASRKCLQVLRTLHDIEGYVSRNEFDMIILNYPEHMLVVLKRTELGWIKQTEGLANWVNEHWKSELLIISVS
jgi:hypothetical protein